MIYCDRIVFALTCLVPGDLVLVSGDIEKSDDEDADTTSAVCIDNVLRYIYLRLMQQVQVRAIGPDDVKSYSIFDIVMPLPGHSVQIPEHSISVFTGSFLVSIHQLLKHMYRNYGTIWSYTRYAASQSQVCSGFM